MAERDALVEDDAQHVNESPVSLTADPRTGEDVEAAAMSRTSGHDKTPSRSSSFTAREGTRPGGRVPATSAVFEGTIQAYASRSFEALRRNREAMDLALPLCDGFGFVGQGADGVAG